MFIGAWVVLQGISQSSEFAGVGSAILVGFVIIWAWLVFQGTSKSSEFAGVRSAVVIRFGYLGFVFHTRDF